MQFLKQHTRIILIILLSLPVKLAAAHNIPWDIDIVPVVSRNVEYLIPPVGTLSSVAAYNLPMLAWLHLPAQWLTGNVWWTLILTLVTFNILSTLAVYTLGMRLFSKRVGLIAAALFTVSEVGVSSSYTAWAQLLLPGFFAMTMLFLWLWIKQEKGYWLALSGIIATAAFMTHFSALLLYPAMLVIALLTRAKWQWRWLIIGAVIVVLMMTPYMIVQVERDFVDVRAFASQETLVDPSVLAQYELYKPGVYIRTHIQTDTEATQPTPPPAETTPQQPPRQTATVPPRWQRAINYALEAPFWYWQAMNTAFTTQTRAIDRAAPNLALILRPFFYLQHVLLVVSIATALYQTARTIRDEKSLKATPHGRLLLLVIFLTTMIALMILTRTIDNVSYWMGFMSIEFLIVAYAASWLPDNKTLWRIVAALVIVYIGIQSTERLLRIHQHDDTQFSAYNVSIYRHVSNAVDYIAEDWDDEEVTVSYDILPDINTLWWVPAWNSIDPNYRMGMNVDFLLSYHHNIENTNTDPIGTVEEADYVVIYSPSQSRYNLQDYTVETFGTILVLKPKSG